MYLDMYDILFDRLYILVMHLQRLIPLNLILTIHHTSARTNRYRLSTPQKLRPRPC